MSESKMGQLIALLERQGERLDRIQETLEGCGQDLQAMRLELREVRNEAEWDAAADSTERRATA